MIASKFMDIDTMVKKIDIAKAIAEKVHGAQTDKKDFPYMAHVNDVAKRVQQLGDDYFIVGLLHDAIEDSVKHNEGQGFQEEIKNLIKTAFDQEVVDAINAMTKLPKDDYFEDYLPRVKRNNIAKEVKIADSSHNLSKAHLLDNEPELQEKLRNKYIKVLNELGVDGTSYEKPIIFKNGEWVEKQK